MGTEIDDPRDSRSLLGLRPPAELAEVVAPSMANARVAPQPDQPARPHYPIVSSGWDNEDTGPSGKTSDLMTAVFAGVVLVVVMVGLGLLIG